MVGAVATQNLSFFNVISRHNTKIIQLMAKMKDAILLPSGNILCAFEKGKVGKINQAGLLIAWSKEKFADVQYFSLSTYDNRIYLASGRKGIFKLSDYGMTWLHMFKSHRCWRSIQAVRTNVDGNEQFWVVEMLNNKWRISIYKNASVHPYIRKNVGAYNGIDFSYAKLAYDGHTYMYVSDFINHSVHVFHATTGQYLTSLKWSNDDVCHPLRLTIDLKRKILYIGLSSGIVKSLKINNLCLL